MSDRADGSGVLEDVRHEATGQSELGYSRDVCGLCGAGWPCPQAVAEQCERLYLAEGLSCSCGHHDAVS